ncbi:MULTISPECIES: hypothetical protein [unclassified Fibrobacter]|uniref:hypothetical protein n=1 Tax=unclassified Fibrobacter TaxID=2634177 RepID=UPI0011149FF6|nr:MULTISPECIES: hypothetical protein [Fibrobacter]MCQ2099976.1 hypothetical protein [Fibrobacter sp.]MDO4946481.1 hypothetical protein [Fibrobacter sp.]
MEDTTVIFKANFSCLGIFIISLICACSDNSSGPSTESWVSNPANAGEEVYSNKNGDRLNGIECSIYASENAVYEVSTTNSSGFHVTTTVQTIIKYPTASTTVYVEADPSSEDVMEALCLSVKKDNQDADIECTRNYVKLNNSGAVNGPFKDIFDYVIQNAISRCSNI